MDTLYLLFYLEVWDIASKDRDLFINEQIRAKEVQLIGDNGEKLGVISLNEALEKAGEKFALSFIRELFCKTFLGLTVMLTAVAVVTIDNYGCMYDFTMMAVRVLQAAGQ